MEAATPHRPDYAASGTADTDYMMNLQGDRWTIRRI